MLINFNDKDIELKFTFNSFKYMQDFDITDFEKIETKPFLVIPITETLLLGGLNHNPKVKHFSSEVEEYLEKYVIDNNISDLLEKLVDELQKSDFFKSLQKKSPKKK